MDDGDVTEVFEDHRQEQIDEYETDSDDDESDYDEHSELVDRAYITRSGMITLIPVIGRKTNSHFE